MTGPKSTTSPGKRGSAQPSAKQTGPNTSTNKSRPNTAAHPATSSAKPSGTTTKSIPPPVNAAKRPSSSGGNDGPKKIPSVFCPGMVTMRLFEREGKFPAAPENDVKQKPGPIVDDRIKTAMAHCFHLALALLESSTGHEALVKVGKTIVQRRRDNITKDKPVEEGLFAGRHLDEMEGCVNDFLGKIRIHGVPVCVTPGIKWAYGQTQRWTYGNDMAKYKPDEAAVVYLNKGMVGGLLEAAEAVDKFMIQRSKIDKQIIQDPKKADSTAIKDEVKAIIQQQRYAQKSFERAIFCISVTLAHEFVHCFTGYLSGRAKVVTPPGDEPYGPYDGVGRGEAGWMWVTETFGGIAHFWYTKGSPKAFDSGYFIGMPMLLNVVFEGNNWRLKSKMYTINHDMIKKIIEMKDWASEHEADPKWMHKIKDQNDKGVLYPEWTAKYQDVIKIWNSQNGLTDANVGKALAMGQENDVAYAKALACQTHITKPLTVGDLRRVTAKA